MGYAGDAQKMPVRNVKHYKGFGPFRGAIQPEHEKFEKKVSKWVPGTSRLRGPEKSQKSETLT